MERPILASLVRNRRLRSDRRRELESEVFGWGTGSGDPPWLFIPCFGSLMRRREKIQKISVDVQTTQDPTVKKPRGRTPQKKGRT